MGKPFLCFTSLIIRIQDYELGLTASLLAGDSGGPLWTREGEGNDTLAFLVFYFSYLKGSP